MFEEFDGTQGTPGQVADGKPANRRRTAVMAAIAAAAIVAIVAVAAAALGAGGRAAGEDDGTKGAQVALKEEKAATRVAVSLAADGLQPDATCALLHVTGTTDGNRAVDAWYALDGAATQVELRPGGYVLEAAAAVNPDGTSLEADGQAALAVTEGEAADAAVRMRLSDGSDAARGRAASAFEAAAKRGEGSLSGDYGRSQLALAKARLGVEEG